MVQSRLVGGFVVFCIVAFCGFNSDLQPILDHSNLVNMAASVHMVENSNPECGVIWRLRPRNRYPRILLVKERNDETWTKTVVPIGFFFMTPIAKFSPKAKPYHPMLPQRSSFRPLDGSTSRRSLPKTKHPQWLPSQKAT